MIKRVTEIVLKLAQKPKNLFLVDAIGATCHFKRFGHTSWRINIEAVTLEKLDEIPGI